jgi:transposase
MVYLNTDKSQNYLIPTRINDLFSKDHVCYLIEQIAESMDYSNFDMKVDGAGHPTIHPRIKLKILMMAGVDTIKSSRRLAKACQENVVYIYLAEKTQPDFRTICLFKKNNPDIINNASLQLTKFAYERGMIDLSHLMVDGTTIKARANDDRILDKETLQKLKKHVENFLKESIKVDEEEDKIYGNRGMHELPEDLNDSEKRRPIVRKIVDEINKSIKEGNKESANQIKEKLNKIENKMDELGLKKYSLTDPDSRFMLNKKGKIELSYNAQIVTDKNGFIVADDVVQDAVDKQQLVPDIEQVEQKFGKLPEGTKISADAGYENGEQMQILDERGFDLYIPGKFTATEETRQKKFSKAKFKYDEQKDIYTCPENKILSNIGKYYRKKEQRYLTIYKCEDCLNCPHHDECVGKRTKQRALHAVTGDKLFNRIREKLQTPTGKEARKLRQQTVERSFGDIKENKNLRSFLVTGIEKVKTEFKLAIITHNLVMINNIIKKKTTRNPNFLANTC